MAKIVDITEKLTFDDGYFLKIKGRKIGVNADAPTMLKIMNIMSDSVGNKEILEAYDMIFTERGKAELEKMKLNFNDMVTTIQEAVKLITGGDEETGEQ